MKRILRILCGILCAALTLGNAVFAQESEVGEQSENTSVQSTQQSDSEKPAGEKSGLRYDADATYPVYAGYTPDYSQYDSYQYEAFLEILQLYADTHLYEFTTEQAKEAFLMKLMQENPELMAMFFETLLTTMDPYSGYYESGHGLASDGSTGGYGIVMGDESNGNMISMGRTAPGLYITNVVKGSPAEQAGILTGDRVVSVEGIDITGLTFEGASYLLRYMPYVNKEEYDAEGNKFIPDEPEYVITDESSGKKSYYLHLEIERNGEIIPVKMLKGRVIYSNITYERAPDKSYSRIEISSFTGANDLEDFAAALELAKKESGGNLLIDLRDNTGGKVETALAMANMLIDEKGRVLCYFNSREHEEPEPRYSDGKGYAFEKITVLVNEYTASAAELLAMTLRYNCGATLVGTTTYGKGVGQQGYTFANGDMFTITSMEVLDPLKRSYHNIGLVPDIEIGLCLDKYDFPEGVGELIFTPDEGTVDAEAAQDGEEAVQVMSFTVGAESENVLALEKRLEILGFLRADKADGVFDDTTLGAIKAFELYIYSAPEGTLDERETRLINSMSEKYRNYYYTYDSQYEVAKMSFSSRSQAKRKAKELITVSTRVEKEYNDYQKAEKEKIKAEEKAENVDN